jgi:hypothetical protein
MARVVCPKCGHTFNARCRAPVGKGTQRKIASLSRNEIQLLDTVIKNPFKTVQEIRNVLKSRNLLYQMGKKWNGKPIEKFWDRHEVQARLSLLVGNGFMSMTEAHKEFFDYAKSQFRVDPVPRYFLTANNAKKYSRWMWKQKKVIVQLPPPLDSFIPEMKAKPSFLTQNMTAVMTVVAGGLHR